MPCYPLPDLPDIDDPITLSLAILIAREVDAERYGWAKFWRDEAIWIKRPEPIGA